MANNRMYLINRRTGKQILLAKYYPSTGWCVFHDNLAVKLDVLLHENEPLPTSWGDNDWEIEFEQRARGESNETK